MARQNMRQNGSLRNSLFAFLYLLGVSADAFDWPSTGSVTIPAGTTNYIGTDAEVAAVSGLSSIVLEAADSSVVYTNASTELTLSAAVSGSGVFKASSGYRLKLTGDNSGLTGHFEFYNSPVEVRSRYGLGGPDSGACKFDRMNNGTLNFYSPTGVITNDVTIDVYSSVLTSQGVTIHSASTDTLVQKGDLLYNGWQNLTLGNVRMVDGILGGPGARSYGAADNREVHIAENARIAGTTVTISGGGTTRLDVGGHAPTTYAMSQWGGHLVLGVTNALGASPVLTLGKYTAYGYGDVDLAGHDTAVKYINNNESIAAGSSDYSLAKSATPATLTMNVPSGSAVTAAVKFDGALDVTFAGSGAYTLINALSTSTGTLSVSSGTLTFSNNAGWGGTNVTVTGGTLILNSANSIIGKKARLVVTGGTLTIASGVELEVASAKFAAAEIPDGTYTASELNAMAGSTLVAGAGSVKVGTGEETFAWPDEPGGSVVVPANTVGYLEEADVAKVANAANITIKNGAALCVRNDTTPVVIAAQIAGSGSVIADGSAGVTFAGDNSGYSGKTFVTNSVVAVTHRYGLGSSTTPEAFFYRAAAATGTLDFCGQGLTNDVALQVAGYHVQTVNAATLVQQNSVRRTSGTAPTFGNVTVNNGQLVGVSSAFSINVIQDAAFTVTGSAYINTWTWNLGISGAGAFVFGATSGTHHYGTFTVSSGSTLRCAGVNALHTPSENGIVLTVASEPTGGLDLNGYSQAIPRLLAAASGDKYACVTSATPATLTLSEKNSQTLAVSFTGAASLKMSGAGTVTLAKRVSTSTGDLTVSSGTLKLTDGAGWTGSNVVVSAGTLVVTATAAAQPFGPKSVCRTALTVSGTGAVQLEGGVEACVTGLSVGGVTYRTNGYYGGADALAAGLVPAGNVLANFTGTGVVRLVRQHQGTIIRVR